MAFMNGGLINVSKGASGGGGGGGGPVALSDGLACFTGSFSGVVTTTISHGLNSTDLIVEFKDAASNLLIPDNWSVINANTIEVEFGTSQTGDIVVIGCVTSGIAPVAGGVVLLEGLSGIIDLDSPNGSILISTSGQVINLETLFTPASGQIIDDILDDLATLSGLLSGIAIGEGCFTSNFTGITTTNIVHGLGTTSILVEFKDAAGNLLTPDNWSIVDPDTIEVVFLTPQTGDILVMGCFNGGTINGGVTTIEGLSGIVDLDSPNDSINISTSGQVINLEALFTPASGAVLQQKCEDIIILSGLIEGLSGLTGTAGIPGCFTTDFTDITTTTIVHGLGTTAISVEFKDENDTLLIPSTWSIIDANSIEVVFLTSQTGDVVIIGCTDGTTGGAPPGCFTTDFTDITTATIVHGLSTTALSVTFKDENDTLLIPSSWSIIDADSIEVVFLTSQSGDVVVIGCDGIATISTGVTTIEGLSGVIDLDSFNNSITISTSGQIINLEAIFTPASGAVLQQKCEDIDTLSGLIGTPLTASGQAFYRYDGGSGLYSFNTNFSPLPLNDIIVEDSPFYTVTSGELALRVEVDGLYSFHYDFNMIKRTSNTRSNIEGRVVLNGDAVVSGTVSMGSVRNLAENTHSLNKEFRVSLSAGDILMFEAARVTGNGELTFAAESTLTAQFIRS